MAFRLTPRILVIGAFVFAPLLLVACAPEEPKGHYTASQADRGRALYGEHCAECHGRSLEGGTAPGLSGSAFVQGWSDPDRDLSDLFYIQQTNMPPDDSDRLNEEEHLAVLAYVLERNGFPAGDVPLVADQGVLEAIRFAPATSAPEEPPPPPFIRGESGIEPSGNTPTQQELLGASDNADDWLYHTHDYTGRRYAALDQINRDNADRLQAVCAYQLGDLGTFQTGPIVYDGVMYLTTVLLTVALDAATCTPIWRYEWEPTAQVWVRNRGVAIKDGRVVRGTDDGYLLALDAANGELLWARRIADPSLGETFTMAPMIFEDLVFIGPAGSENNVSGWLGAFRLSDGEPLWRFNTVPGATDEEGDTWPNPEQIPLGGGAVWTPLSLDVEQGELYLAVTNPAPDLPAHLRPGANLYTNSLVALDVRTGELRWYDQLVPNDGHDWDLTQVSPVFTTEVRGERRNVIAAVGKDGILHLLDRVSRERLWATPVTTRLNVDVPLTTEGVHVCPGVLGGVEWNGPAYNPRTNSLYVPAVDWCTTFAISEDVRFVEGELYLGGSVELADESQGWLTAVDASSGEVNWRYRSERPMLAAVTTTAGELVFTGEMTGDFLALDARSGQVLYKFNTGGDIGGGVVTYAAGGKQYVAVMSGNPSHWFVDEHRGSATAFVFALPDD